MPKTENPQPLQYGTVYHIVNRGNNKGNIFNEERNYVHFLNLWKKHIAPVADTYGYCLLKNHFHAMIFVKNQADIEVERSPSQAFSNFFNAYAQGFNKAYSRVDALFKHPFGRIIVDDAAYQNHLLLYIQTNAQKHGFVEDFKQYPHSSYHSHLSNAPTLLLRDEVLSWFGGREGYIQAHEDYKEGLDRRFYLEEE